MRNKIYLKIFSIIIICITSMFILNFKIKNSINIKNEIISKGRVFNDSLNKIGKINVIDDELIMIVKNDNIKYKLNDKFGKNISSISSILLKDSIKLFDLYKDRLDLINDFNNNNFEYKDYITSYVKKSKYTLFEKRYEKVKTYYYNIDYDKLKMENENLLKKDSIILNRIDNILINNIDNIRYDRDLFITTKFNNINENYIHMFIIVSVSILISIIILFSLIIDIVNIIKTNKYDKYSITYLIDYIKNNKK